MIKICSMHYLFLWTIVDKHIIDLYWTTLICSYKEYHVTLIKTEVVTQFSGLSVADTSDLWFKRSDVPGLVHVPCIH